MFPPLFYLLEVPHVARLPRRQNRPLQIVEDVAGSGYSGVAVSNHQAVT